MPSLDSDGRLLDRIFETSPTAIIVLTPEGTITRCNERAETLLDLAESELEGQSYQEPAYTFTDGEGEPIPDAKHPFRRVREKAGPIFDQEYRLERPEKTSLMLSVSGAPVVEDDEVRWLVFSFEDITERREQQKELEMMTRQLEVLNRVVRHDIRNEMSVILGYIETAAGDSADSAASDYLDRAYRAGEHVVSITNAARELMDVVTRSDPLELSAISIRPILTEEINLVREGHPAATVEIDGAIPPVEVRATELLDSVFRNLLTNAIDHNDRDAPSVTISATQTEETLQVIVADDGPGIPEGEKWTIFEKGEQGLESDGSGIGLYLVEALVTQFGGDVWTEDNEPRGTKFVVELQLAD